MWWLIALLFLGRGVAALASPRQLLDQHVYRTVHDDHPPFAWRTGNPKLFDSPSFVRALGTPLAEYACDQVVLSPEQDSSLQYHFNLSSLSLETPRPVKEGGEAKWQINLCKPIPADSIPGCTAEGDVLACAGELSIAANKDTTVITPTLLSTEPNIIKWSVQNGRHVTTITLQCNDTLSEPTYALNLSDGRFDLLIEANEPLCVKGKSKKDERDAPPPPPPNQSTSGWDCKNITLIGDDKKTYTYAVDNLNMKEILSEGPPGGKTYFADMCRPIAGEKLSGCAPAASWFCYGSIGIGNASVAPVPSFLDPSTPGHGFKLDIAGGLATRTARINYQCDTSRKEMTRDIKYSYIKETNTEHVEMTVLSASVCITSSTPDADSGQAAQGSSGFARFLLIVFVLLAAYLVLGCFYRIYVKGARPGTLDMLPNLSFWAQLGVSISHGVDAVRSRLGRRGYVAL